MAAPSGCPGYTDSNTALTYSPKSVDAHAPKHESMQFVLGKRVLSNITWNSTHVKTAAAHATIVVPAKLDRA